MNLPNSTARQNGLTDWIDDQLQAADLPDEVALLVLAALEGDTALDHYLDDGVAVVRPESEHDADEVEASGVVLTSIKVEGFRGIGPACELAISPRPGLTVVAGRNGSGKSSFSEALELVLTGGTYRWANKSAEWRHQWRNLHHGTAEITVGLVEEGAGPISITSSWSEAETSVEARTVTSQAAGSKVVQGIGHLGWDAALEQFRPILSYDELGGMLEGKQSELYDALASILGVELLGDAVRRLKARSDARKGPGTAAKAQRKSLRADCEASTDERASEAATLLRKTDPDTERLRSLATGRDQGRDGEVAGLRTLSAITVPDEESVYEAVRRLKGAKNALADAGAEVSRRDRERLRLLEQGLALHAVHGDQPCPLCSAATLDDAWAESRREIVAKQSERFADVEAAHGSFNLAFDALRRLVQPPPAQLSGNIPSDVASEATAARNAWVTWADVAAQRNADGADQLIAHVESSLATLISRVNELKDAVGRRIGELDDRWQPLAGSIAAWCAAWDDWKVTEPVVTNLQAAEKWLKDNDLRLKNERLAPIQEQARQAWRRLRQESNVDLDGLELTGTSNRRRVRISGAIDGEQMDSFAVFSQGELHALALSLFLPRATLSESPFRFVVLDDPVQAMDPAKVDGLVELLGDLAKTRQVIVFSHDDRLPAALRRSAYDATIVEVNRSARSAVSVVTSQDPTARYLDDAHGLIKEWEHERLSEDDLRRTLPGLYRFAIESASKDRFFATRLAAGESIHSLDRIWRDTHTTRQRILLAIYTEQPPEHVAAKWFSAPYRKFALGVASSGFHQGLTTAPDDAHRDTKRLVADLREGSS